MDGEDLYGEDFSAALPVTTDSQRIFRAMIKTRFHALVGRAGCVISTPAIRIHRSNWERLELQRHCIRIGPLRVFAEKNKGSWLQGPYYDGSS
jgi:hypothetical protein